MKSIHSSINEVYLNETNADRFRIYGLDPSRIRKYSFNVLHSFGKIPHIIHDVDIRHIQDSMTGKIKRDTNILVGVTNKKHRKISVDPDYVEILNDSLREFMPQEKFKLDKSHQREIEKTHGSFANHGVISLRSSLIAPSDLYTYDWRNPNLSDMPPGYDQISRTG